MDRLAALGYFPEILQGTRPWTRLQCARLVAAAQHKMTSNGTAEVDPDAAAIVAELITEFHFEMMAHDQSSNRTFGFTTAYVRGTEIAGPPLRDAFHFGQTIADDFGRPYGQGFNLVSGAEVHATYGPVSLALRGEYQDARALFAYNSNALQSIALMDDLPIQATPNTTALSRARMLEATVALNVHGWRASFGEQNQWWGQARSTSLLLSNNAEAPVLLRLQREEPVQLPWLFAYLGKINNTFFIGQLRGHHYVRGPIPTLTLYGSATKTLNPQPFLWGDHLDLKVSPNLEFGFEIVSVWAGYGRPATLGTWLHTFSFVGNAQDVDPGKRFAGFQFAYRLPGARNVTLYSDMVANDEPTPLVYPHESAMNPGVYFAQIPKLRRMDLRVEGMYTNIPNYADGVGAVYFNQHYASGYRNAGQVMGSWVGRAGTAVTAQTTYWISGSKELDLSYRRQFNDRHMVGGGGLTDVKVHGAWHLRGPWHVEGTVNVEQWKFPILRSGSSTNAGASFGLIYEPSYR